jgi:hypothetical protein
MRRRTERAGLGISAVGLIAWFLVAVSIAPVKSQCEQMTPAGIRRVSSNYVKMRDGVEIAVSLYLPADLKAGERVPVLMRTTRYWREMQAGWALKMLTALHLVRADVLLDRQVVYFNQRQFAVLLVDARGSGASGGNRAIEYSAAEVADMGEVAAWVAQQPWSNGRVGTFGISYEANTAELAAVPNQLAIRAVMPLYDTFDNWDNLGAGGVRDHSSLREWSDIIAALDRDDVCGGLEAKGWHCWIDRQGVKGVRPVDADPRGKHLAELVNQRHNLNVAEAVAKLEFRDDQVPTNEGAFALGDISPSGLRAKIESSKVPMMVWCGWLDGGGGEDALTRYQNFFESAGGGHRSAYRTAAISTWIRSHRTTRLRYRRPKSSSRWKPISLIGCCGTTRPNPLNLRFSTTRWAKGNGTRRRLGHRQDSSAERLYFGEHSMLSATSTFGRQRQRFLHSGLHGFNRQPEASGHTGFGGGDVVYPDRAKEDRKLLVYTSEPLEATWRSLVLLSLRSKCPQPQVTGRCTRIWKTSRREAG